MTRLRQIVAAHRAAAARDNRSLDQLVDEALAGPRPRDFAAALRMPGLSVVAEVKRRSPSAGDLRPDLDPAEMAAAYVAGGARCISVLTDVDYFGGSPDDLEAVRSAVDVPILRKDFTVDPRDVVDARIMGADAILLIVAALDDGELRSMLQLADRLALTALVEVHDGNEIVRASAAGARVIGVNQRNLHTFEIDLHSAQRHYPLLPAAAVTVAESGIATPGAAAAAFSAGYDAVLVGSSLVTSNDPSVAVRSLIDAAAAGAAR